MLTGIQKLIIARLAGKRLADGEDLDEVLQSCKGLSNEERREIMEESIKEAKTIRGKA